MTATPPERYMPLQDAGGVKVVVSASRGKEDCIGDEYIDVVVVMMGNISPDTDAEVSGGLPGWLKNERSRAGLQWSVRAPEDCTG